jgi:hypothetical protein
MEMFKMYSRTYQTRKNNQNHTSAPQTNPFIQRSFGVDTPQQTKTSKSPEELEAPYQEQKQRGRNWADIPVYPPGTEPPNPTETSIFVQQIQAQIIQRNENEQQNNELSNVNFPSFESYRQRPIQAKMSIGEPGDKYEQEADQVASQVVNQINSPTSQSALWQSVQRVEAEEEEEIQAKPQITSIQRQEEEEKIQTKSILQRKEAIGGGEASQDLDSAINP